MTAVTSNTRIEIHIKPWAVTAADGSVLQDEVIGYWFTPFSPLYSHSHAVQIEIGAIIASIPTCVVNLAIYEASKWADAIDRGVCTNANNSFFQSVRWRYVTLLAAFKLITNTPLGYSSVVEKTLGDLTIKYGKNTTQEGLLNYLMKELKSLEPVVEAGGCEGIGSGPPPLATVKGANDPYRPIVSRLWMYPHPGASPFPTSAYTPGANRNNTMPDRYQVGGALSSFNRW